MSRYVAVRSVQFHCQYCSLMIREDSGLITRYDCVVIDEAQKLKRTHPVNTAL